MSLNYDESLTDIVNAYIGKESLCMLLLASSILFYDMAKKRGAHQIPRPYALLIAILLILYSAILGVHSGIEFYIAMNDVISKCIKNNCDANIIHFEKIKNFYVYMGVVYALILIFITYVLIRFD